MTEAEQQAFSIYELIGATSANRPMAFRSTEEAQRETAAWQATNPGLQAMRRPRGFAGFSAQLQRVAHRDRSPRRPQDQASASARPCILLW